MSQNVKLTANGANRQHRWKNKQNRSCVEFHFRFKRSVSRNMVNISFYTCIKAKKGSRHLMSHFCGQIYKSFFVHVSFAHFIVLGGNDKWHFKLRCYTTCRFIMSIQRQTNSLPHYLYRIVLGAANDRR